MPVYDYVAINKSGKHTKGSIDAESMRSAKSRLRQKGLFPTELNEAKKKRAISAKQDVFKNFSQRERVSHQDLCVATRQLATLIGAGLPLVSALNGLVDQTDAPMLRRVMVDVREKVEEGSPLAKTLGGFPKVFPRLYINLIRAGEASGTLDQVLEKLADHLEAQMALRRKVRSALTYPVIMLFVCTAVIIGLIVGVIPRIVEIFIKQGTPLPLPTKIMIALSDFIISYWWLLLGALVALVFSLKAYYQKKEGRANIDRLLFKLPIVGRVYVKVVAARVAGTLGTLLTSGVDLLQALDITRNVIGNVHVVKLLEDTKERVREGKSLATELSRGSILPSMLSRMIAVGEQSGSVDKMLMKAAHAYESEVESSIETMTSLLEPLMLVVVGGIVLVIVISVLLPMTELINVVAA